MINSLERILKAFSEDEETLPESFPHTEKSVCQKRKNYVMKTLIQMKLPKKLVNTLNQQQTSKLKNCFQS